MHTQQFVLIYVWGKCQASWNIPGSFYNLTYKTQLLQETNALDERG